MSLVKDLKRKRGEDVDGEGDQVKTPAYKQRVLILSSRGISQRQRHLMSDMIALLPHSKKDAKLDSKHQLPLLNELCDLSSCNNALFFEARRKHNDLYLWAAKAPNGPSIRFHVLNAHTMDEMKMTGNCLKGSRPIVVFGKEFDSTPEWRVIKEVLMHIFAVPKTTRRAKPFIDHVLSLSLLDGKVWFRNYQILDTPPALSTASSSTATPNEIRKLEKELPKMSLSEIGPRFVLTPVKIFEGSFNGATIYENKEFIPSSVNALSRKTSRAKKYKARKGQQEERRVREEEMEGQKKENELSVGKVFA